MKPTILILVLLWITGCKKDELPPNMIESNVDFNGDSAHIELIQTHDIFRPTPEFLAYFSAAAMTVGDQFFFIGTQAAYDHDFAPSDFQIKRTDFNFNEIGLQKVFKANVAKLSSVTPSLIRVGSKLQFYYLQQESISEAQIYMMESNDQGESWSEARKISFQPGFNGIINDRVVCLSSGRIIIPVAFTSNIDNNYNGQYIFCYYSDDDGVTWFKSSDLKSSTPLMEPSIAEYSDGQLLMVIRSVLGKLLFSRSTDGGLSWSVIEKSRLNAPASTSALYKLDEEVLVLIWNNTKPSVHVLDRKPLSLSVSNDQGQSWSLPFDLGNQNDEIYSSPGMFKNGDDWIVYFNFSGYVGEYGIRAKKIKIKY